MSDNPYDDIVARATAPEPPKPFDPVTKVRSIAQKRGIPIDVADDFLKLTGQVESGNRQYTGSGEVLRGPETTRNRGRAFGFGHVMPDKPGGTVRTIGGRQYDLTDEDQNIEAGLSYFFEGGNDPVARRLYYFGGPGARNQYLKTGKIPEGGDGYTSYADYVKKSGGFSSRKPAKPTSSPYDAIISQATEPLTKRQQAQAAMQKSTPTPADTPPAQATQPAADIERRLAQGDLAGAAALARDKIFAREAAEPQPRAVEAPFVEPVVGEARPLDMEFGGMTPQDRAHISAQQQKYSQIDTVGNIAYARLAQQRIDMANQRKAEERRRQARAAMEGRKSPDIVSAMQQIANRANRATGDMIRTAPKPTIPGIQDYLPPPVPQLTFEEDRAARVEANRKLSGMGELHQQDDRLAAREIRLQTQAREQVQKDVAGSPENFERVKSDYEKLGRGQEFQQKVEQATVARLADFRQREAQVKLAEEGKLSQLGLMDKISEIGDKPSQLVPFLSSATNVYDLLTLGSAAGRLERGEATEEDVLRLREFNAAANRDSSFMYKVANVVTALPSFVGEFAATGGIYSAGRKAAVKGLERLITKQGLAAVEKKLVGRLATKVGTGLVGAAAQTLPAGATRIPAGVLYRQQEGQAFGEALRDTLADQFIEIASERAGGLLSEIPLPTKLAAIRDAITARWISKVPGRTAEQLQKLVEKTGWNGPLGEIFEERVGDVGRYATGLQESPIPTLEQLAVEGLAFSLPGAVEGVANRALRSRSTASDPTLVEPVATSTEGVTSSDENILAQRLRERQALVENDPGVTPPAPSTPRVEEKPGTLIAQFESMMAGNGNRKATILPANTPSAVTAATAPLPPGVDRVVAANGDVVVFKTSAIDKAEVKELLRTGRSNELVGHPNPESPEATLVGVARVAEGPNKGEERFAGYLVPGNEDKFRKEAIAQFPNETLSFEFGGRQTEQKVIEQRTSPAPEEEQEQKPTVVSEAPPRSATEPGAAEVAASTPEKLPVEAAQPAQAKTTAPASTVPEWVRENIDLFNTEAERSGIADKIEGLSRERLTAKQIAEQLGVEKKIVYAVRSKRGIPSMEAKTEFEEWLAKPSTKIPAAQPTVTPPTEVKTQPSATESQLTTPKEVTDEVADSSVKAEAPKPIPLQAPGQEAVPDKSGHERRVKQTIVDVDKNRRKRWGPGQGNRRAVERPDAYEVFTPERRAEIQRQIAEAQPEDVDNMKRMLAGARERVAAENVTTPVREYKKKEPVQAEVSAKPFTWKTKDGQTMHAEAGDWRITHPNGRIGSVKPDIFKSTYEPVAGRDGWYMKTAPTKAQQLDRALEVETLEGPSRGKTGDYLVTGEKGERYIVSKQEFEDLYRPAEGKPEESLVTHEPPKQTDYVDFPAEMGPLGIRRAAMPQIKSEHRGALANRLKARGIGYDFEEVLPGDLKPSQAEFSPEKVERARGWTGPERKLLVSSEGFVLDGHHQWKQKLEDAPETPIPIIRLQAPAQEALLELAQFPSSDVQGTHGEYEPDMRGAEGPTTSGQSTTSPETKEESQSVHRKPDESRATRSDAERQAEEETTKEEGQKATPVAGVSQQDEVKELRRSAPVERVKIRPSQITKKGNALAFDAEGNTITGQYLHGSKTWVISRVSPENAVIEARRFGEDRESAASYASEVADATQTRSLAWWGGIEFEGGSDAKTVSENQGVVPTGGQVGGRSAEPRSRDVHQERKGRKSVKSGKESAQRQAEDASLETVPDVEGLTPQLAEWATRLRKVVAGLQGKTPTGERRAALQQLLNEGQRLSEQPGAQDNPAFNEAVDSLAKALGVERPQAEEKPAEEAKVVDTTVAEEDNVEREREPARRVEPEIRGPRPATHPTTPGAATTIKIPGTSRAYAGRYSVREVEDLIPSHNPQSFQPNPDYFYVNDRRYDREPQYKKQVIDRSKPAGPDAFDPAFLINNSPTAETGAPIIDQDGNVLGGNSRAMIIHRVYASNTEAAEAYRQQLKEQAAIYGLDAQALAAMKKPVLVRELDDQQLLANKATQQAITEFNVSSTTALTQEERAVSGAQQISAETADYIARKIENKGEDATLAQVMDASGVDIINRLIDEGVFTGGERNSLLKDGKATAEAKARVEKMLVGRVYRDLAQMETTAPVIQKNIERVIAPALKVEGSEWDIAEPLKGAIDALNEARGAGMADNLDEFQQQQSFVRPPYSNDEIALAKALQLGPRKTAEKFRGYANDYEMAASGGGLFGAPAQAESFALHFSGKLDVDPLFSSSPDITDSEAFRNWFGDSKVVDEDGKPLVVYHGSGTEITTFDQNRTQDTLFWFTSSRKKIESGESGAAGRTNIIPVYLSIKNPAGWDKYERLTIDQIIQEGHDGLILDDDYVAFSPEQIKSATSNRGTFDPNDPNILMAENPRGWETAEAGPEEKPEFSIKGNHITLNNAARALMSDAYGLTRFKNRLPPNGIGGSYEKAPSALAEALDLLAAQQPERAEGAKALAAAVREVGNQGPVSLAFGEKQRRHEGVHRVSHEASGEAAVDQRHTAEGFKRLEAHPAWPTIQDSLLRKGYPPSLPVLADEAFAYLATGDNLGLADEEADSWMEAWLRSFKEKNGSPSIAKFKELSNGAEQARQRIYAEGETVDRSAGSSVPGVSDQRAEGSPGTHEESARGEPWQQPRAASGLTENEHRLSVAQAINTGKNVPAAVLKEYPGLAESIRFEHAQMAETGPEGTSDLSARVRDLSSQADQAYFETAKVREGDSEYEQVMTRHRTVLAELRTAKEALAAQWKAKGSIKGSDLYAAADDPLREDYQEGGIRPDDTFELRDVNLSDLKGHGRSFTEAAKTRTPRKAAITPGPIIVTGDMEIVDGFNRAAEASQRGDTTIQAWVNTNDPDVILAEHDPFDLEDLFHERGLGEAGGVSVKPKEGLALESELFDRDAIKTRLGIPDTHKVTISAFPPVSEESRGILGGARVSDYFPRSASELTDRKDVSVIIRITTADGKRDLEAEAKLTRQLAPRFEEPPVDLGDVETKRPAERSDAERYASLQVDAQSLAEALERREREKETKEEDEGMQDLGDTQFAEHEDPWARLLKLAEDIQRPEGQKARQLPKTFEAAEMEIGTNLFQTPTSIPTGIELGKQTVAEKGIDGAIEFVKTGDGIGWASTGYEVLAQLRADEQRIRPTDAQAADAIADKRLKFLDEFVERSTELGRAIVGIKAIEMFAPERAAYHLNKLSQKRRKRGISKEEEARIHEMSLELARINDELKAAQAQIDYRIEVARSLEEDLAAAEARARRREKYQPGAGERQPRAAQQYEVELNEQAVDIKNDLIARLGSLNFGNLKVESRFPGQAGAAGLFGKGDIKPLPGDAELLAQYTASQLATHDTVADLNKHLLDTFGAEVEPYLSAIRQRAFQIRKDARLAELANRETGEKRSRTILAEIQKEIAAEVKAVKDLERAHVAAEKERKKAEKTATQEAERSARRTERAEAKAGEKEQREEARKQAKAVREQQREARLAEIKEARARLKETRKEYQEASEAETKGWRATSKAQREAARTAGLWDTPIRQAADEARARLATATDVSDPSVMEDLAAVAAAKFIPDKPGGPVRKKAVFPSKVRLELIDEFPNLVTKENLDEIYKRGYQRILDMEAAAREAARLRSASKESQQLWEKMGVDTEAQALLIQRATKRRQQQELRHKMNEEFERVSRSRVASFVFELNAFPRSAKSSIDAPELRQGMFAFLTHPQAMFRTISAAGKGYTAIHPADYHALVEELQRMPRYELAKTAGMDLPEIIGDVSDPRVHSDEYFQSGWGQKVPHIRVSEQAYVLSMNTKRMTLFNLLAPAGEAHGYTWENNPEFFKQVASFINDVTGRGNVPESMARFMSTWLNWFFFAPRYNVSKIQLLNDLFNPLKYISAEWAPETPGLKQLSGVVKELQGGLPGSSAYDPIMRAIAAEHVIRWMAALAALGIAAWMLGFSIVFDLDDADSFPKIRWGNTSYDLSGGELGTVRFMYRFLKGIAKMAAGQRVSDYEHPGEIAGKFFRQKLSPWAGAGVNWLTGTDAIGQPASVSVPFYGWYKQGAVKTMQEDILVDMIKPIVVGDFLDGATDSGWLGVARTTPALLGLGVQTYPRKEKPSSTQKLIYEKLAEQRDQTPQEKERTKLMRKLEEDIRQGKPVTAEIEAAVKAGKLRPDDPTEIARSAQLTPVQLAFKQLGIVAAMDVYADPALPAADKAALKELLINKGSTIENLPEPEQDAAEARFEALTGEKPKTRRQQRRESGRKRSPRWYDELKRSENPSPSPTP